MKNIKLIVGLLFICSCSPVVTNTLPSPSSSPTKSPNITLSPTGSSSPTPSVNISPNPSMSPSSIPSDQMTPVYGKVFKSMKILNSLGQNMVQGSDYERYEKDGIGYSSYELSDYNSLFNDSEEFTAEVTYTDGSKSKDDIIWSSEDPSIATINQNGLVKSGNKEKSTKIKAAFKYGSSRFVEFTINVIPSYTVNLTCDKTIIKKRFIPYVSNTYADIAQLATFDGKVYDINNKPVKDVKVNARSTDAGVNWVGQEKITNERGEYIFINAPVGSRIAITVSKNGFATRTRSEVSKSNLLGDPCANFFNFGGLVNENKLYAIQDEPEIIQLKINGITAKGSSIGDVFVQSTNAPINMKPIPSQLNISGQITGVGNIPSVVGVNSNTLDIEMTFSEPVNREDVENNFRITSQSDFDNKPDSFIIDKNYPNVKFEWSADDKTVTFKTNKHVLANRGGDEARYLIDFSQAFRDKAGNFAINRRYFRFSDSQVNDFAVFSVKNDDESPKLLGITAKDGGSINNDIIELRYSESMELIDKLSYPAILTDLSFPLDTSRQLYAREANSQAFDLAQVSNNSSDNNATLLGYLDTRNGNNFKASYMVGRILAKNVTAGTPRVDILGKTVNTIPTKVKVISTKISNNIVTIALDRKAFDRDDRIIVSLGDRITGSYVDRNRTPPVNEDLSVNTNPIVEYSTIYDPSGRLIQSGNSSISANIDVDNKQRVATAS